MGNIAWHRLILIGVAALAAFLAAAYGRTLIHGNHQAIDIIVTVFSILAGFLVAIITIIGDAGGLLPGSWRIASKQREVINRRLTRQKWIFYIYLTTLGLIFLSSIIKKQYPMLNIWVERFYIFFAVFGFFVSMALPVMLLRIQKERVDAIIEARKKPQNRQ